MEKKDVRKLCEKAIAEAKEIMSEPIVDPKAKFGFVRREWFNAEMRRRIDAVGDALDRMVDELAGDDELMLRRLKKTSAVAPPLADRNG